MLSTQKVDYPEEIVGWLKSRPTISFTSRSGGLNAIGYEFMRMIKTHNLTSLMSESLSDARTLILNGLSDRICPECGSKIRGSALRRLAEYCSMTCYKKSPLGKDKISSVKSALYSNKEWKDSVESKKRATCRKNFGVDFPMQDPSIHAKHEKSSLQSYTHRGISGLRGYEKYAVDWFIDELNFEFGKDFILGSSAKSIFDQRIVVNGGHRYPDFYVVPWNTYVEIKSDYTLAKFESFDYIYDVVEELGSDYIVLCYNNGFKLVDQHTRELIDIPKRYRQSK